MEEGKNEQTTSDVEEDIKTGPENGEAVVLNSENDNEAVNYDAERRDVEVNSGVEDTNVMPDSTSVLLNSQGSDSPEIKKDSGDEDEIELQDMNDDHPISPSTIGDVTMSGIDDDFTQAALKKIRKNAISCAMLTVLVIVIVVLAIVVIVLSVHKKRPPHIVLILAEDLGWNDVGWHNPDVMMPVLNQLAADGVIFNQTYVQPLCTPSRVSLMTGYYPFRTGNQHQILFNLHPSGLPLEFKLLPERLKDVGYLTHNIGKWDLGFCKEEYLPTRRGFDSHYGSWTGGTTHYGKIATDTCGKTAVGYDFRDNTGVVQESDTYLTFMLAERAVEIIKGHSTKCPLFLQFSLDIPGKIPEVPPEYEAKYSYIADERTRKFYGKMSVMDDAISSVVEALKTSALWEDTLFIFISDNGALACSSGSNWPFRGTIATLFEGATRVPAFAHGNMLKRTGYVNNQLWHMVDLHQTILSLAGAESASGIDGMNMWETFSEDKQSPRKEIVYNIDDDELSPGAAIRVGDYKLITGNPDLLYPCRLANESDGWYNFGDIPIHVFRGDTTGMDFPPPSNVTYLFNIKDDPEERNNTAELYPEIVQELHHRLDEHRKHLVPAVNQTPDVSGDPKNFGGVWSAGWC